MGKNKKIDKNKMIKVRKKKRKEKRIMDLENRLVVAKSERGSEVDGELGVNRCKLLLLEWISSEILLCSTGNSV